MKAISSAKTRWRVDLLYLESCNCDWGCSCIFTFRPTHGNCIGMGAMHITRGFYGKVEVNGLNMAWVGDWPGPVHEGHGKASFYIDERATDAQFSALSEIIAVGGPMAYYRSKMDEFQPPRRARISFTLPKGLKSKVTVEGVGELVTEPMKDPDGKDHRGFIELPEEFAKRELASSANCVVDDGYLKMEYAGTFAGFQRGTWKGP